MKNDRPDPFDDPFDNEKMIGLTPLNRPDPFDYATRPNEGGVFLEGVFLICRR